MFRALQPYTVSIYANAYEQAKRVGAIELVCEGVWAWSETHMRSYDDTYGLMIGDDVGFGDAARFVVG